ncbi:hypothetical protein ACOMHN_062286 [Nucella lapillus]
MKKIGEKMPCTLSKTGEFLSMVLSNVPKSWCWRLAAPTPARKQPTRTNYRKLQRTSYPTRTNYRKLYQGPATGNYQQGPTTGNCQGPATGNSTNYTSKLPRTSCRKLYQLYIKTAKDQLQETTNKDQLHQNYHGPSSKLPTRTNYIKTTTDHHQNYQQGPATSKLPRTIIKTTNKDQLQQNFKDQQQLCI